MFLLGTKRGRKKRRKSSLFNTFSFITWKQGQRPGWVAQEHSRKTRLELPWQPPRMSLETEMPGEALLGGLYQAQ